MSADDKKKTISLVWAETATGEFKRKDSTFRSLIPSDRFPAVAGRYHLYISHACPWAHRTMIVRALKGLEHVISVSVVHWLLEEKGWRFSTPDSGEEGGDKAEGCEYLRELYFKADPGYEGRFTVPVLWDTQTKTIVNNESAEIIRIFNSAFNHLCKRPDLDLYPVELRADIDGLNAWVYDEFNNGVYKAGFATKQEAYSKNCQLVFQALDKLEAILTAQEYLVGSQLTEADIRAFTTALRFDPVYHGHFKCNIRTLEHGYPAVLKWMKRIYHMEGISKTVNMHHIKHHYYESHIAINPTRVVPLGSGPDLSK